jgi:hypothetical protein
MKLLKLPVSIHQLEGIAVDDLGKRPHRTVSPRTKVPLGQKPVFISLCFLRCATVEYRHYEI